MSLIELCRENHKSFEELDTSDLDALSQGLFINHLSLLVAGIVECQFSGIFLKKVFITLSYEDEV